MDKSTLRTMEAIELELVKIHGEDKSSTSKTNVQQIVNLDDPNDMLEALDSSEPIDTGAVDHSSDSEYEPSASATDKNSGKFSDECRLVECNWLLANLIYYPHYEDFLVFKTTTEKSIHSNLNIKVSWLYINAV